MQKFILTLAIAAIPALAQAHDFTSGSIFIEHPMIQEAPPNAPVLGGYVTIHNNGDVPERLVGIESKAAEKVELHQSVVTDGIARMEPLAEDMEIPAGATVSLGDDGTHAMFIKPDRRYQAGDEVAATLIFETAGPMEVVFNVEERSAKAAPNHEGHGK